MGNALITRRGGGKPEGMYVWKKYSVSKVDNSITKSGTNYTLGTATSDTIVYYSTSYTFDESTGIYTLVNPQSANLAYNGSGGVATVSMKKSKYYIWGSTSSDKIYTTNDGSTYNVGIKNASGSVYLESTATNKIYDIHSAKTEYAFLDYVVSDKETAYPDGGEKGGYWYERASEGITPEMFGLSKMEVVEYIPASSGKLSYYNGMTFNHSLGITPVLHMLVGDRTKFTNLDTNLTYPIFGIGQFKMYTFHGRNYHANNDEYIISVSGSAESVTLKADSSSYEPWFNAGTTYKFIFMA